MDDVFRLFGVMLAVMIPVAVGGAVFVLIARVTKRMQPVRSPSSREELEELTRRVAELEESQKQVQELAERVDFVERVLPRVRDAKALLVVLISTVLAAPALAQSQGSVARAIALPDTLGANFAAADSLTGKSGPTDYGFLVGTWRFTFQARRRDGAFTPAFSGHWVFTKKQTGGQGVLIEDHWRPDDNTSTWDAGTWTYRAYNPEHSNWEMRGINTNVGSWQPGLMWSAGADRVLIEWYGPMLVRFRYFAIAPDKFLWRADATFDRGQTWLRDYWTMEAHRISR